MYEFFSRTSPLVLIGCGRMGGAMALGWLKAGVAPDAIYVVAPSAREGRLPGVPAENYLADASELNEDVIPRAMILAVKPQMMDNVLPLLKNKVGADTLVISVAAGVTLAQMERGIGAEAVYVRSMPNTPAAVGAGITGMTAGPDIKEEDKILARELLTATGPTVWVEDEAMMNAVTGVSGSGPAYVFYMVECMAAAGVRNGLPEDVAMQLARQTVIGAGRLMDADEDVPADELRRRVTSPGGTTAAGLNVLMHDQGLGELMFNTVTAARKRGEELAG